jgi:exosortase
MLNLVLACLVSLAVVWSFWPTLKLLAERWWIDPQYSHGFLVPVFAGLILWLKKPAEIPWQPNAWGLALMAASLVPRWFAARMDLLYVDGASLIGTLLGLALLVGGKDVLRWAGPSILFLAFMIPLPDAVNDSIAIPLRRLATVVSTYVLQTFGYPAIAEGNVIQIEDVRLGVIEACSGLGMLMTFLALATAMALIVPDPIGDRIVLVLSAIPIAILANVIRITVTGMLYSSFGLQDYRETIHTALGLVLMMPLALLLLWLELKYLRHLLVPKKTVEPLKVPLAPWLESGRKKPLWS